jgi:hypothetical protein
VPDVDVEQADVDVVAVGACAVGFVLLGETEASWLTGAGSAGGTGGDAADVAGCGGLAAQAGDLVVLCGGPRQREFLELFEVADGGVAVGELLPQVVAGLFQPGDLGVAGVGGRLRRRGAATAEEAGHADLKMAGTPAADKPMAGMANRGEPRDCRITPYLRSRRLRCAPPRRAPRALA